MSKVQMLRASVKQRLTAAAQEIFELFERTISEYEEELCKTKEQNLRQKKLLEAVLNPEVRLNRTADFDKSHSKLVQEDPETPHIKEEQDQLCISQEGEQLQGPEEADVIKFTDCPVPLKSEDEEEKPQVSPLHQRQTKSQMKTEADGDDHGGSEPARNSHPNGLLQPVTSVKSLKATPFERRTLQEKLSVKELGPDQPDITIKQQAKDRGREYTRSFSRTWFDKKAWLTACRETNALFCFPCLLFPSTGSDPTWIHTGMTDLKHFSERAKKHEQSGIHMENAVKLAMFGRVKVSARLDEGYRLEIHKHNEEVDRNRHILSKIIDCVKFCGTFAPTLRGLDVSERCECSDAVLRNATVFKVPSKTIENELLGCMLSVLRECITEEIRSADFVSILAEETTECQLALVFRYIDKAHNVQERFYEFIPLQAATADSVATELLDTLSSILPPNQKSKLISQAYDGSSVMRGTTGGVQKKVQDVYVNAHYVHCYSHQLHLIIQQVTSHISKVSEFFNDLGGFSGFFSSSPERTSLLDRMVAHELPRANQERWNFHSHAVYTVFEHKDELLQCFQHIRDSGEFDPSTVREAGGFVRLLEDDTFCFFLELFHRIMPHVDTLYSQLQARTIDSTFVQGIMQQFTDNMQKIRDSLPTLCGEHGSSLSQQQPAKRRRTLGPGELQGDATEVCDCILDHVKERFTFTQHLISATLLQIDSFQQYKSQFPEAALSTTVQAYPQLNKNKLHTELALIYRNEEFQNCSGAVALYQVIVGNYFHDTFSETVALLKILITTPLMTAESERRFSTRKRIQSFLRNTPAHDHLNALAMLSMEKRLVKNIPDFNHRVIEKFASLKERRAKFMYRK